MLSICFNCCIKHVTECYGKIKNHSERTKTIEPFIDQYNWEEINFPSDQKDWKEFESNNKSIALNILYVSHNARKLRHAYKSKYNLKSENQVILLMITDGTKWNYLAVKTLSELLRGITGNNHGDFYCFNCLHSHTTKNRLKKHQKICENHEHCKLEMTKIGSVLKYIFGEKSIMTPFIIYADLESILEKMSGCENDPAKSSTIKVNKHIASGYSLFSHSLFDKTKNKLDYYRGKICMKNFSLDLREHAEKIINYKQAKIIPPTKEERKANKDQKVCYIFKRAFSSDDDKYYKIKNHCYYPGRYLGAAHAVCNKKCKIPKEIPVVFHNGSTYDYHFIIKVLAKVKIKKVKIQKNILNLVFLFKRRVMMVNQLCIK